MISQKVGDEVVIAADSKNETMVLSFDGTISTKFKLFCEKHRIISPLLEDSWIDFERISGMFSLQGDLIVWFSVAVYITWKSSFIFQSQHKLNLIKILNDSHISLCDFLNKCNKWIRMNKSEISIKTFISKLNISYNISSRLFSRYCEKYCVIFQLPENISKVDFSYNKRKQRKKQCSDNEIFHYIWILFISSKTFFPEFSEDSLSLLHLLSCCFQHVFSAALINPQLKIKILNKNFSGLPQNYADRNIEAKEITHLSQILFSYESETFHKTYKNIYDNHWKRFINEMITKNIFKAESRDIELFLEPDVFSHNLNQLNIMYEENISLHLVNLDERQFLYSLYTDDNFNSFSSLQLKILINSCKLYAKSCDSTNTNSPFLSPMKTPSKLSTMSIVRILSRIFINPSKFDQELYSILKNCNNEIEFIQSFLSETLNALKSTKNTDFIATNFEVLSGVYYKLLLSILKYEQKRDQLCDLTCLLTKSEFHSSIFCVSLEIIIYLFEMQTLSFPFSLTIHKLDSFQFFKVIELVIRSESDLSRNIIQHFNTLEELIISYYAWNKNSTIFKLIKKNSNIVPKLCDVSFPSFIDTTPTSERTFKRPTLSSNNNSVAKITNFSAFNLFQDRDRMKKLASATRNLFFTQTNNASEKSSNHYASSKTTVAPITPPIITLTPNPSDNGLKDVKTPPNRVNDSNLLSTVYTASSCPPCRLIDSSQDDSSNDSTNRVYKTATPLVFFMRKVYHLASSRLQSLCDFFQMEEIMRSKCWTCLENVITKSINLLEDHYIDQVIMCCAFVLGRSTNNNWPFNEILKWYRNQKYCDSKVYLKVQISCGQKLLSGDQDDISLNEIKEKEPNEYGDLITYYNKIFLNAINDYVHLLNPSKKEENKGIILSPLPRINGVKNYNTQKISNDASIYVSPKKLNENMSQSFTPIYQFPNSPSSQENIFETCQETMVSSGKRRLGNLDDYPISNILYCHSPIKVVKS